jgi:hypothetical protein
MFDNNYTFGFTNVICDGKGCGADIDYVEGFDGHPPDIDTLLAVMKRAGWVSRRIDGEWLHLCPECQNA